MAKGNYGNLVPHWLMPDLQQLLKRKPLEEDDCMEKYYSGGKKKFMSPGGRTRHWFKDWSEDIPGYDMGHDPSKFVYSKGGEYDKYLSEWDREIGEGASFMEEADIFDPVSFASAIGRAKRLDPGDMPDVGTYTAFTPDMFRGLHTGAYQEDIEEGRGSLLDNLMARTKKAQSLGGGLAGYGQRGAQKGVAQQSYLGGMGDVYAGVDEQKSAALQSIYDVLGQYETIQGA